MQHLRLTTEFNETVASFIGQEASVHYEAARPEAAVRGGAVADERALNAALVIRRQSRTCSLLGAGPERRAWYQTRATVIKALLLHGRCRRAALRLPLNDACLALSGTYAADLTAARRRRNSRTTSPPSSPRCGRRVRQTIPRARCSALDPTSRGDIRRRPAERDTPSIGRTFAG
jgi:hypothetical protein